MTSMLHTQPRATTRTSAGFGTDLPGPPTAPLLVLPANSSVAPRQPPADPAPCHCDPVAQDLHLPWRSRASAGRSSRRQQPDLAPDAVNTRPPAARKYRPPARVVFGEEEHEDQCPLGSCDLPKPHWLVIPAERLHRSFQSQSLNALTPRVPRSAHIGSAVKPGQVQPRMPRRHRPAAASVDAVP